MVRRILWALLALTPLVILARYVFHLDETALFVLSALALIPLAWLIGEATEHAAEHTGPGVGGFLNASFGNAPELIIALFAVADGLPGVVRGSLTGSVVSNILLVLGAAMIAGGDGRVDARSLRWQLAAVLGAVGLLLIPSVPAWNGGSHERTRPLRALDPDLDRPPHRVPRHHRAQPADPPRRTSAPSPARSAWTLRKSLAAPQRRDARDRPRLGDPRPLARPLRARGRPRRVLHRGRDRRDRRQRGRARRRGRDRPPREHEPRHRDRGHLVDAGRAVRRRRPSACSRGSSDAGCRSRSARSRSRRWPAPPCSRRCDLGRPGGAAGRASP